MLNILCGITIATRCASPMERAAECLLDVVYRCLSELALFVVLH